ncbi:MAG: sulfurtransferase complex subunit TusB [Pseudomonadales bacterium]
MAAKILHTFNKSPISPVLDSCLRFTGEDDALVLLEDGVYTATAAWGVKLDELIDAGVPVYVIKIDVDARGLANRLIEDVQVIEYDGFVDLCANYEVVKSWF